MTSARQVHRLYERTIDYGAHPNQLGLFTGMRSIADVGETTYLPSILTGEALPIALTLQTATGVGVGSLKIFRLVFPTRFELLGLDLRIEELAKEVDEVFKPYAQESSSDPGEAG